MINLLLIVNCFPLIISNYIIFYLAGGSNSSEEFFARQSVDRVSSSQVQVGLKNIIPGRVEAKTPNHQPDLVNHS